MSDRQAMQSSSPSGVNVKVVVRCRPFLNNEKRDECAISAKSEAREVTVRIPTTGRKGDCMSKTFSFDGVCPSGDSQQEIFHSHVKPIIDEVLQGFNCTVFAYGQTGTGKTYTMEGDLKRLSELDILDSGDISLRESFRSQKTQFQIAELLTETAGIIPRSVSRIFECLENQTSEYTIRVSYLEIYNEELNDLLQEGERQSLRIFDDPGSKKGLSVDKLEEISVHCPQDIFAILATAAKKRKTAETLLNHASSRSHSIFSITIHMKETSVCGEDVIKIGKLNLVDLAGSENVQKSGANQAKDRTKEAGLINQSLLTLGRVINSLVEHASYVPYRDSKLTRLLQESLGGKTKTTIFATISPAAHHLEETLSTLDYAYRAKNIRNRPEVNQRMTKRIMIRDLNQEIERLKVELQWTREKNGVFLSPERLEEMENMLQKQQQQLESHSSIVASLMADKDTALVTSSKKEEEAKKLIKDSIRKEEHIRACGSALSATSLTVDVLGQIAAKEKEKNRFIKEKTSLLIDESLSLYEAIEKKSEKSKLLLKSLEIEEQCRNSVVSSTEKSYGNLQGILKDEHCTIESVKKSMSENTKEKIEVATTKQFEELLSFWNLQTENFLKGNDEVVGRLSEAQDETKLLLREFEEGACDSLASFRVKCKDFCCEEEELQRRFTEERKKSMKQLEALHSLNSDKYKDAVRHAKSAALQKTEENKKELLAMKEMMNSRSSELALKVTDYQNEVDAFKTSSFGVAQQAQDQMLTGFRSLVTSVTESLIENLDKKSKTLSEYGFHLTTAMTENMTLWTQKIDSQVERLDHFEASISEAMHQKCNAVDQARNALESEINSLKSSSEKENLVRSSHLSSFYAVSMDANIEGKLKAHKTKIEESITRGSGQVKENLLKESENIQNSAQETQKKIKEFEKLHEEFVMKYNSKFELANTCLSSSLETTKTLLSSVDEAKSEICSTVSSLPMRPKEQEDDIGALTILDTIRSISNSDIESTFRVNLESLKDIQTRWGLDLNTVERIPQVCSALLSKEPLVDNYEKILNSRPFNTAIPSPPPSSIASSPKEATPRIRQEDFIHEFTPGDRPADSQAGGLPVLPLGDLQKESEKQYQGRLPSRANSGKENAFGNGSPGNRSVMSGESGTSVRNVMSTPNSERKTSGPSGQTYMPTRSMAGGSSAKLGSVQSHTRKPDAPSRRNLGASPAMAKCTPISTRSTHFGTSRPVLSRKK